MTTRLVRRLVFEGTLHRFLGSLHRVKSFQRPAAVDDDRARLGEQPADLARRVELSPRRLGGATHGDIFRGHRAKSLEPLAAGTLRGEVQRPWGKGGEAEAWIYRIVVPTASFASRELGRD